MELYWIKRSRLQKLSTMVSKVVVEKNLRLHPRFLPTKRLSVGRSFFHVVVVGGGGSAEGSRLLEVASFAKFARNWSH